MKNICILDIETTGLDPYSHEIIEIGALLNGKRFNVKVMPRHPKTAEKASIRINGYTQKKWEKAVQLQTAMLELTEFAKGSTLATYNVSFDWLFLHRSFALTFGTSPFIYHRIDIMSMVYERTGKIMTLKEACKEFGIREEPKVHRAINGANRAYQVMEKLI